MNKAQQYIVNELSGLYSNQELQSVSRLLLSHITGLSFTGLLLNKNTTFSDIQWHELKKKLAVLKTGMPIQYVLGETEFCGFNFSVGKGVLIPRPETEELVEWAVGILPLHSLILDIGTGSGCIAVAIQRLRPDCTVWACDVSDDALKIAAENARQLQAVVNFLKIDILNQELPDQPWDLIISNPPYIPYSDSREMESQVKDFEPGVALFVSDDDPLLFYRAIANKAIIALKQDGLLMVETHRSFAGECVDLFAKTGFRSVTLRKDIAGNDRMILAKK